MKPPRPSPAHRLLVWLADSIDRHRTLWGWPHLAVALFALFVTIVKPQLQFNTDRSALVVLCQQWSVYCAAHRHMRQKGALSPYRAVAYQALAAWSRMNDAFGLTPSSRTRVTTAAKTDADQLDTFLA